MGCTSRTGRTRRMGCTSRMACTGCTSRTGCTGCTRRTGYTGGMGRVWRMCCVRYVGHMGRARCLCRICGRDEDGGRGEDQEEEFQFQRSDSHPLVDNGTTQSPVVELKACCVWGGTACAVAMRRQ